MRQKHQQFHQNFFLRARRSLFALALFLLVLPAAFAAAPTRTTLAASTADTGTILSATVKTSTGAPVNAGTVDFLLPNGQSLGSAIVAADGAATLTVAKLPAGTAGIDGSGQLAVSALYHANAAPFSDSASVATRVASSLATTQVPDFIATANPATVTAPQGSYGATAITVSSVGNYSGIIQFSCSNLPAQITCAFNPTQQVLAANGSFTGTLQLQTQAASGPAPTASLFAAHSRVALALVLPGALALFGISRRRGFRRMLGVVLLLAGAGLGLSGCSQRYNYLHHPPPVSSGAGPGTYAITVAVDGGAGSTVIEHDVTVSLVIQ